MQAALVPLLVSALLAGVLRFAGRATMGPRLSAAGVGLGILATYGLAMGVPPLPPVISLEKIAYVTAAGLILGVLIDLTRVAPFARWFAFAALLAAALYWLAEHCSAPPVCRRLPSLFWYFLPM